MNFLYPEFLWAFAVLIVPIVIHLFNFKRYKTVYFSSLTFIKHVDQTTKSTQKLKHLLILLSRLLAFSFLILAFAQPYFKNSSAESSTENPVVFLYLDNSFSMQARGSSGELLSEAREQAENIVNQSDLGTRFIIATNDLKGSEERILNTNEALKKIDQINFSPITKSISDVLNWQNDVFSKKELSNARPKTQIILFSDFQKLKSTSKVNKAIRKESVYPVQLKPENENNVFIDSAWFTSPIHKLNSLNELNFRVGNNASEKVENIEVNIQVGSLKKTLYIDVEPNQKTVTSIRYTDKKKGLVSGYIRLVDDHVFFDDTYYISYEIKNNTNVLILNGENAVKNFASVLNLDSYYKVEVKEVTQVTKNDFFNKDIVYLNGSDAISPGFKNLLLDFSSTGGSIALFPGTSPNKSSWNALLSELKLPTFNSTVNSGTKIKTLNFDDPFFKGVFESRPEQLNLPSVNKVFQSSPSTSSLSSTLLTLQNGLPLFSYNRTVGNNFMFYSSLDPSFGNFTKDALFSTITLRMSELSQRPVPLYLTIGSDARYPIYQKTNDNKPIHIKNSEFDFIPEQFEVSGTNYIALNSLKDIDVLTAGNYTIETDKKIGVLSLNYNGKESILKYKNKEEIIKGLKDHGFSTVELTSIGKSSQIASANINKPFSYWKICIILTLIFVGIEMLLIRFLK